MLSYRSATRAKPAVCPVCPYCRQPTDNVRYGVRFTRMQVRIIDELAKSNGMTARQLAAIIHGDSNEWNKIRSHIHDIRAKLIGTSWQIGRPMGMKWGSYAMGQATMSLVSAGSTELPREEARMSEISYGFTVSWDGGNQAIVTGCGSLEEAYNLAWRFAFKVGYKRPKWWEFWRWQEARAPAFGL